MKIYPENIDKCFIIFNKQIQINIPLKDSNAIKQLFSESLSYIAEDKTWRAEFSLKSSSPITIYEWDCQDTITQLIKTGSLDNALEIIHQIRKNNLELIVAFFLDLYYLKRTGNNSRSHLVKDWKSRYEKSNNRNDDYLESKFHQELLNFCIKYLQDKKIQMRAKESHQQLKDNIMESDKHQAIEVRREFAQKLEKIICTLRAAENEANKSNGSGSLGLDEHIAKLNSKKERLQNTIFRFLTLGEFNRGKSTLLNVLLHENILPMNSMACTAMPIIIKYGEEKKVVIYKKNNKEQEISIEEFRNNFTYTSGEFLKQQIQKVIQHFQQYKYAELYYSLPILQQGIEFIDTPGLNNTVEEDKNTLTYIDKSDAIFFVMNAEQLFTQLEEDYLKKYIKGNVETVFYLINRWNALEEEEQNNARIYFNKRLAETLNIDITQVEKMWDKKIFTISAKEDLKIIKNQNNLDGTTCQNFWDELNDFLLAERLDRELDNVLRIGEITQEIVELRLATLSKPLKVVQNNIEKLKPHFDVMKMISENLKKTVDLEKEKAANKIVESYRLLFQNMCDNFEQDFISVPKPKNLGADELNKFTKQLQQEYEKYIDNKYNEWKKNAESELETIFHKLNNSFEDSILRHEEEKDKIKNIIKGKEEKIESPNAQKPSVTGSRNQLNLETGSVENKLRDRIRGVSGGFAAGSWVGVGGVSLGIILGGSGGSGFLTALSTTLIAAGSLTPIGWGVLASASVCALIGVGAVNKFKQAEFFKGMKKELQDSLPTIIGEKQLKITRNYIENLFNDFYLKLTDINDDVIAIEKSLNNLIKQKINSENEINYKTEEKRLKNLVNNISSQVTEIKDKLKEY